MLLSCVLQGAARYLTPLLFVAATIGGTVVHLGALDIPYSETLVALSVLLAGVLVLARRYPGGLALGLQEAVRIVPRGQGHGARGQAVAAPITVSCGVAAFPEHGASSEELLRTADRALYQAKNSGRDRVVAAYKRSFADRTSISGGIEFSAALFEKSPFKATRYHSLVVERASMPEALEVTAESEDGEIMGVRHRALAVEGVQFHPEALLTEHGHRMLKNFLEGRRQ